MNTSHLTRKGALKSSILRFCMVLIGMAPPLTITPSGIAQDNSTPALRLVAVKPSVLFKGEEGMLLQKAYITIENNTKLMDIDLEIKIGTKQRCERLPQVKENTAIYEAWIPDINEPTEIKIAIKTDTKVHDHQSLTWQPQRHWTVFMTPICHHDVGYTDTIENILGLYNRIYDEVLTLCDQTNDWPDESKFRYMAEGAWSIQHFIENRPEHITQKLGQYLREGRIEVSAFYGNEISGLCGHEELIRLMYPTLRIRHEYGMHISSAVITDIPGLSWGIPTILAGAGVRYFFAGLPTYFDWRGIDVHTFWDEAKILRHGRPDAFRWQGPDGGEVLVYYQGGYGCWNPRSYQEAFDNLPAMLQRIQEQGNSFSVVRYGCADCGDNTYPNIYPSQIARDWNEKWAYPKLIVATHSMFFAELEKQCQDAQVFRGELPHTDYVVGATSSAKETGINRITHDRLNSAEKFLTIASILANCPYTKEKIDQAYDNMLLYDEHTWGMAHPAGQMQDWNWSDKSRFCYKAAGLTESVLSESLNRISNAIALPDKEVRVVVFNPLSFVRTDIVRVHRINGKEPFDLIDEQTGKAVPYQIVCLNNPLAPFAYSQQRYAMGAFDKSELYEIAFVAEDVPPIGYKTYRLVTNKQHAPFQNDIQIGQNTLENKFFKIAVDDKIGAISSIYDKEFQCELADKNAPHKVNQFIAKDVSTNQEQYAQNIKIQTAESGPVYSSIMVTSQGPGCPQITSEIILYSQIKRIDFYNRILKDSVPLLRIYFAFPFEMKNPDFRFEGSNSVIKPIADQFPGSNTNYYTVQHWADVSNGKFGITITPIEPHLLSFSGLWPCYVSQAHHGVTPPGFGEPFVTAEQMAKAHIYSHVIDNNFRTNFAPVQQSDMLLRFSITSHKGNWETGYPRGFGWSVANPLIARYLQAKKPEQGKLGKELSFCQIDSPNVLLTTLKQAEDGDGIILRLIETEGKNTTVTATLPHFSIKEAHLASLIEDNISKLETTEHEVTVLVKAFGIATVRIILKE